MAEPASTVKSPVEESRSEVAGRVGELREQAATAPGEARDAAWRWFEELGEEARHDRSTAAAALEDLFRLGTPPAGIDGRTEGILVAPLIAPPIDRLLRGVTGTWMPWQGKRFDPAAKRGDNVLTRSARWPAKLFWPLYRTGSWAMTARPSISRCGWRRARTIRASRYW
jgi:hypothetical protein